MKPKRIVFLSGTRADFGKVKSLIQITQNDPSFDVHIFATGMHMNSKYGFTVDEIYKSGFRNVFEFINHDQIDHMDRNLAKTIDGFSHYVAEFKPDLIIVHGDRVEALAGAIVGSLNNILVGHIEGGEISGTIDELLRHSVSKLSHLHFVANEQAMKRLIQMGELPELVFPIGSPDLDLMNSSSLPSLEEAKNRYGISFDKYAIAMFHPVTTEYDKFPAYAKSFVDALIETQKNYIVIYPNNDLGSTEILREFQRIEKSEHFKVFPSLRFEHFLTFLKHTEFVVGNSSVGIREAPFYKVPTVNIGTRQNNRADLDSIFNCDYDKSSIISTIEKLKGFNKSSFKETSIFGTGNSAEKFIEILRKPNFWLTCQQKQFQEIRHD